MPTESERSNATKAVQRVFDASLLVECVMAMGSGVEGETPTANANNLWRAALLLGRQHVSLIVRVIPRRANILSGSSAEL